MTDSSRYWRKREEEQRKHNVTEEAEYEKHIRGIYRRMIGDINDQIYGFFAKYASDEGISMAEAKRRAATLDIEDFAEKAKKYVKEKDFSDRANREMRIYNLTMRANRLELLKAQIGLELCAGSDELDKWMREQLEGRTLEELERMSGILGESLHSNEKTAHSIVNASFHNATFSDRIWANQSDLRNNLSNMLTNMLIQGQNPRTRARDLQRLFDVSRRQAERLLRTELCRVQIEAQRQSYKANNFDQYTFLALGTACKVCAKLDGDHFDVEDMEPGTNAPPMHPNCMCSTSPYMDTDDFDAWLDGIDQHGLTWEEWKKKYA